MAKLLGGTTIGTVSPQNATSNTTGSLQVSGGVGITGSVYSGSLFITGASSNGITFADSSKQTVAASPANFTQAAFNQANSTNTYAFSAYAQANSTNTYAFSAFSAANTAASNTVIIQGVDTGQNTRMTIIEGVDTGQNTRMTIIEGVDTGQNTRMTIIEGVNTGQNTRMTIIEGVDTGQNTRIDAAFTKANGAVQTGFTTISGNGTSITTTSNTGTLSITGDTPILITGNESTDTVNFTLRDSGVTPGSYTTTNITVDSFGRVTSASNGSGGASITDDNSSDTTQYPVMSRITTGTLTTGYVASTDLSFNPSTGTLSSVIFTSTSDEKHKDNIITLSNALDTVQKLRGVEYTWKNTGEKGMGVVAQELEKVLPELVHTNDNGDKTVAYQNMVGLLIEAIKELKDEIDTLKKEGK